jgi:phage shock protein A
VANVVPGDPAPEATEAQPSYSDPSDSAPTLRREITRLEAVITDWQKEQALLIDRLVEEKIEQRLAATIKQQMALVEQREASMKQREEQLDAAWKRLEARLSAVDSQP